MAEGGARRDGPPQDGSPASGEERVPGLPSSLHEALLQAAAELPGLVVRESAGHREFVVGSRVVATLDGPVAEFRLDPAVAAAALRTPGTRRSATAAERIAFEPEVLDRYAADRAAAWLESAVRQAR